MKYYIIAGEASGDLHASNMIKELKVLDPDAEFRFWGGDLMAAQIGHPPVKHYRNLAFMGFLEVLLNIRTIIKNIKFCKIDILEYKPDVLILVDYPGFNLRIAEFAHKNGIKVFYYIAPTIWAWHESRIKIIKKYVDKLFVILPFEKEFYKKFDFEVDFIGNPLIDALENDIEEKTAIKNTNQNTEKPVIAILPGSRKQEICKILPVMLSIVKDFPDYKFVIAGVNTLPEELYQKYMPRNNQVSIVYNQTYSLLKQAVVAMVKSGTSTMEAALFNVPQVVCYKTSMFSYFLGRMLINLKFISLVNLVMDRPVVKELIQSDLNYAALKSELEKLLFDEDRKKHIFEDYYLLKQKLGGRGASKRLAELIHGYLK